MRIINFGQIVDLEHGMEVAHQITVESENGRRTQIRTDEHTIQQLVDALSVDRGSAPPNKQPEIKMEFPREELEPEDVFGGDFDPGELVSEQESVMGVISETVVESAIPVVGLGQSSAAKPKPRPQFDSDGYILPVRARTVPKDDMGYPIVPHRSIPVNVSDDEEGDGTQI